MTDGRIVHGGDIYRIAESLSADPKDLTDFSSSINPAGFPPWIREEISRNISAVAVYPDITQKDFISAAAEYTGVSRDMILPGNGAGELINIIPPAMDVRRAVIPVPSYGEYERSCRKIETCFFPLKEEEGFIPDFEKLDRELSSCRNQKQLVFLGQPNNPTGVLSNHEDIVSIAADHPETLFCIDESFAEFVPEYSFQVNSPEKNIILLRSMTKFYAVPGLRLGYCIADPLIIRTLKDSLPPWTVNSLALAVGARAFADSRFRKESAALVRELRDNFSSALSEFSWLKVFPSASNFILVKITENRFTAEDLYNFLLKKRIVIRRPSGFRELGSRFFRLAVRTEDENLNLVSALMDFEKKSGMKSRTVLHKGTFKKKKTPALMIQGTASNAGKSIITAGLCRILHQEGIRVTPFKAQNMSLNSAVTPDGLEMGRAQALQAAAAGIDPDVRMNPLLLKPSGGRGSDVILSGKSAGYISSGNWFDLKEKARRVVRESYDSLSSEYDAVILEGAGSPGEINLKQGDLVNMAMAEYASAPVLLVGDIDRGGVYASMIGTMEVFEEWERNLVRGFIVNKFRGNRDLLESAHSIVKYRTGKPVIGVVPYFKDLYLPEEDSVSFKEGRYPEKGEKPGKLTIGIIDLPSISNFTDFDPFKVERDTEVVIIRSPLKTLEHYDAVIIPGSKMVEKDLMYLKRNGFDEILKKAALKGGTEIIGICGGFQILGRSISDPQKVEADKDSVEGLGLLDVETRFYRDKRLSTVEAVHIPSGLTVTGYEIHHGRTELIEGKIIIGNRDNVLGVSSTSGRIWGTYIHGIFDSDPFRHWFINRLKSIKGMSKGEAVYSYDLESNLNKLADILRESLDMGFIMNLLDKR